jgi:hypothetical protein
MGNRGNIRIVQDNDKKEHIYLYSHWGGTELPLVLKKALSKKWRWNDTPYLARIIFDELIGSDQGKETGYGISSHLCDNEHNILEVDCQENIVRVIKCGGYCKTGDTLAQYSFEDYIALSDDAALALV